MKCFDANWCKSPSCITQQPPRIEGGEFNNNNKKTTKQLAFFS